MIWSISEFCFMVTSSILSGCISVFSLVKLNNIGGNKSLN